MSSHLKALQKLAAAVHLLAVSVEESSPVVDGALRDAIALVVEAREALDHPDTEAR